MSPKIRHLHAIGWRNTPARSVCLMAGWVVVTLAAVAAVAGYVGGGAWAAPASAMGSVVAWVIATVTPEPTPAPRSDVQRRMARLARLDGHQLPA